MVIRVKSMSHVRKREKIVLNQSLIYIHPFPPNQTPFFYLPFHYVAKKTILRYKKYWRDFPCSPPKLRQWIQEVILETLARCPSHHLP